MTGVAKFFSDKIAMMFKGALQRPFDVYLVLTGEIDNFSKLSEVKRRDATTSAIFHHTIITDLVPVWSP
jgi:hypothetical protein